jgi:hypothetical protein
MLLRLVRNIITKIDAKGGVLEVVKVIDVLLIGVKMLVKRLPTDRSIDLQR